MPFKSRAQRGYMFEHHPEIAHRWAKKYGATPLSELAKKRKRRKRARR